MVYVKMCVVKERPSLFWGGFFLVLQYDTVDVAILGVIGTHKKIL